MLVNVTARKIRAAKGAIAYNVVDDSEVCGGMERPAWATRPPSPTM